MAGTFSGLNTDVQLEILNTLHQTSPKSLLSVSLVSKSLYELSKGFIYRVIPFSFTFKRHDTNVRLIKRLLIDEDITSKVHELRILWAPSPYLQPGEGSRAGLELLGQALPKLTGLKTFVWDAQYPILSWLLKALESHVPSCKLYTRSPTGKHLARTLALLRASPCLFALDVTFSGDDDAGFPQLRSVLDSCGNMQDLAITCEFHGRQNSVNRQMEDNSPPLQLRSLELHGQTLSGTGDIWKWPVVWPGLERLSTTDTSFLPGLAPQLTGLKSLQIRLKEGGDETIRSALWSLLEQCNQLTCLDLTGCTADINVQQARLWEHLGKALVSLRIHQDEIPDAYLERPILSITTMEIIADNCQRLRSLGLDIECIEHLKYRTLKKIADVFWFIQHLEINFEINIEEKGSCIPRATTSVAEQMWAYLWQQTKASRQKRKHSIDVPRLRSLDVVGGPYRPVFERSEWEAAAQQRFQVNISERDDEAHGGIAVVRCAEIEALKSKFSLDGPFRNDQQETLATTLRKRADKGPFFRSRIPSELRDGEMTRAPSFWDKRDERRFYHR